MDFTKISNQCIESSPKFRIIVRDSKYVAQMFCGIWKLGVYVDFSYIPNGNLGMCEFEHNDIKDAEACVLKGIEDLKNRNYKVKEYKIIN